MKLYHQFLGNTTLAIWLITVWKWSTLATWITCTEWWAALLHLNPSFFFCLNFDNEPRQEKNRLFDSSLRCSCLFSWARKFLVYLSSVSDESVFGFRGPLAKGILLRRVWNRVVTELDGDAVSPIPKIWWKWCPDESKSFLFFRVRVNRGNVSFESVRARTFQIQTPERLGAFPDVFWVMYLPTQIARVCSSQKVLVCVSTLGIQELRGLGWFSGD